MKNEWKILEKSMWNKRIRKKEWKKWMKTYCKKWMGNERIRKKEWKMNEKIIGKKYVK